jgi:hypothetical protein
LGCSGLLGRDRKSGRQRHRSEHVHKTHGLLLVRLIKRQHDAGREYD